MADDRDRLTLQAADAADQRMIVGVHPVAVQLLEIGEAALDVVHRVRPLRMARELNHLPRRQIREDTARQRLALLAKPLDLLVDVDLGVVADELQRVDLRLELGDRLLEIQEFQVHMTATHTLTAPYSVSTEADKCRARRSGAGAAPAAGPAGTLMRTCRRNASGSGGRSAPRPGCASGCP